MLNSQLDQLNSALDALEQKNNYIQAQFKELLESNKETRQQLKEILDDEDGELPEYMSSCFFLDFFLPFDELSVSVPTQMGSAEEVWVQTSFGDRLLPVVATTYAIQAVGEGLEF
ncbi:unnamed protein product [Timema podura]|uniref:Uncharacterized protein n=1 Tax=Timema podura TaxID=61482 RepID=A0ABN7P3C9_TIMPD|nr:unnamed protein product [Timema podura]